MFVLFHTTGVRYIKGISWCMGVCVLTGVYIRYMHFTGVFHRFLAHEWDGRK